MPRTLKLLSLTAIAMVAMTAFVAASANAAAFTSNLTNTTITGVATEGSHTFSYQGREITCKKAKFTGFQAAKEASSLSIFPSYEECHSVVLGNLLPVTVTLNGCTFLFTPTTPTKDEGVVHICPGGQHIDIHIYSGTPHSTGNEVCTYTITSQTINVEYHNVHPNITVTINDNFIVHRVKGAFLTCGAATASTIYKGNILATGESGGIPTAISVD